MNLHLEIINPIQYPEWDKLLLSNPEYSFFHSSCWARVLSESYRYNPIYFTLIRENKLLVAIPLMEVKSLLSGQRAVSLPFSDYCDPIVTGNTIFEDILDYLIKYGKNTGWRYIEIRGGKNDAENIPPFSYYYRHILSLSGSEETLFSNFRESTKRNIKKAIKKGVKSYTSNSLDSINEFYRLNCITRRMHGLPPQPYYFFKKVYEHIISKNQGHIVLANYKDKVIAGAIFFHFGKKALYKYGASDRRYQHTRANNLVMWEAIKWYLNKGYENFSFGRTEPENTGLRQFKKGWGAVEKIIKYYRYDFRKGAFISSVPFTSAYQRRIINILPIPLLRIMGSLLYRHVG